MQCSRCKDYRPGPKCDHTFFVCLACGQTWKRWKTGSIDVWHNNGVFDFKRAEGISEALNNERDKVFQIRN